MAQQHLSGNLRLRQAWPKIEANTTELYERTEPASEEKAGLMSAEDKAKLDGIEDGAQVNQNAFAKVNDLEASDPSDAVTITGGTGITTTTNPNTKEVIITATGEATPGPHGSAHLEFGSDPIPYATETDGGLMTAEDKQKLTALDGLPQEVTELKAGTVTQLANVKTGFGAKGDGVTEDSSAFTSAISALPSNGGVLFVPPGTYLVQKLEISKENLTVYLSRGATLKLVNTNNQWIFRILKSNVKIIGEGVLDCDRDNNIGPGTNVKGIRIDALFAEEDIENVVIDGIEIKNVPGNDGIYITGSSDTGRVSHATIKNCYIHDCDRNGITIIDGQHITIRSNRIEKVGAVAVDFESNLPTQSVSDILAINNYLSGGARAVDIAGTNCIIENNEIRNFSEGGILIAKNITENTIRKNKIYDIAGDGIYSASTGNMNTRIIDNEIETVTGKGINITGPDAVIHGNKVKGAGDVAISVTGSYSSINANKLQECVGNGITVAGGRGIITDNNIYDCGTKAIVLSGGDNVIADNWFRHETSGSMTTAVDLGSTGNNVVGAANGRLITTYVTNYASTDKLLEGCGLRNSGTTEQRPSPIPPVNYQYFDTTVGKPIFSNGTEWVDMNGDPV